MIGHTVFFVRLHVCCAAYLLRVFMSNVNCAYELTVLKDEKKNSLDKLVGHLALAVNWIVFCAVSAVQSSIQYLRNFHTCCCSV